MEEYNKLNTSLSLIDANVVSLGNARSVAGRKFWKGNGPNIMSIFTHKIRKLKQLKIAQQKKLKLAKRRMLGGRVEEWNGQSILHKLNNYEHILKIISSYLPDDLFAMRLISKEINPVFWSHQLRMFTLIAPPAMQILPSTTKDEGYPLADGTMGATTDYLWNTTEYQKRLINVALRRSGHWGYLYFYNFVVSGGKLHLLSPIYKF